LGSCWLLQPGRCPRGALGIGSGAASASASQNQFLLSTTLRYPPLRGDLCSCLPNGLHGISSRGTAERVLKLLASLNEIRAAHVSEEKDLVSMCHAPTVSESRRTKTEFHLY
jgi:hypothetical protein